MLMFREGIQKYAVTGYRALFGEDRDWTPCCSSQREIA